MKLELSCESDESGRGYLDNGIVTIGDEIGVG